MSLIAILNRHVRDTPDQIVLKLKANGWIKGSDMPDEVWQDWRTRRRRVAICHINTYSQRWEFDGSAFNATGWTCREVMNNLSDYWFMLSTSYERDVWPYPLSPA